MTTATKTDAKRVYLDNMGTDGFGSIYESNVVEYNCRIDYDDSSRRIVTRYKFASESDESTAYHELSSAMSQADVAGGPSPVSCNVIEVRPALLWWQQNRPGKQGEAQYVTIRRRGQKIAEDGPGNLADSGREFDLHELLAIRGAELAK